MFSYVFMKILEGRPESYDRRMDKASAGRVGAIKRQVVEAVKPGSRVLEIGCGTGELAAMLAARGCQVVGFDQSKAMIKQARKRIAEGKLKDVIEVSHMGVDGMDGLAAGAFDTVVSTLVMSELSQGERHYALRHAARCLAPGGRTVIAAEVEPRRAGGRLLHALSRAPALAMTFLVSRAKTTPVPDLAGEIRAAGFTIEREDRSHGDAFAVVQARLGGQSATGDEGSDATDEASGGSTAGDAETTDERSSS